MRNYDAEDQVAFHQKLRRIATAFALLRERHGGRDGKRVEEIPNAWHDRVSTIPL